MLVNSKVLFEKAQEGHYAIPSANVLDMESIKNHIQLAEKLGLPLIVGVAESHLGNNISLEDAVREVRNSATNRGSGQSRALRGTPTRNRSP